MKLDGTAAKRVKGSVKRAKPAQLRCRRARGDEPWEEKWDWCRRRNQGGSPWSRGMAEMELGTGKWPEPEQGARWSAASRSAFAPLVEVDAKLPRKKEIWTKKVFFKKKKNPVKVL